MQDAHTRYMREALKQAQRAYDKDEVPIGAIVVSSYGKIIARAHNMVEAKKTQVAHAELLALMKAGKKCVDWRLEDCWLYVTLEPCMMCLHAVIISRLKGLVYGATSPLFGYHLDKYGTLSIYKNRQLPLEIVGGVGAREAEDMLKEFFRKKRMSSEWSKKFGRSSKRSWQD